jgi:uncharacterized membrane protein
MLRQALILLHLFGVVFWVGGMAFAYLCLRPAAAQVLQPPQRLPLWAATFGRFLPLAAVAVAAIVLSGFTLFLQVGFKLAPPGWHLMMAVGLLMAAIFVYVYGLLYPRLRRHCDAADWPAAGAALNAIRQGVGVNLLLAVIVLAAAALSR